MKRILLVLILLFSVVSLLAVYGAMFPNHMESTNRPSDDTAQTDHHPQQKNTPTPTPTPTATPTPSPTPTPEPTPTPFVSHSNTRPIAIMIDNDNSDAWPQAGLEDAYVIYEAIVEGGSTRFMALYRDSDAPKIGPIRSARHYFLDYLLENDAIYVHFGWSPKAAKDILRLNLDKINGVLGSDEHTFWREPKRKWDYHDVYTSMENIKSLAQNRKYRNTSEVKNFIYSSVDVMLHNGQTANKVIIPYSYYHKTYYEYDPETKLYKRWMRGEPHMLSTSEQQVSAKNIIIQFVKNYYLGDGEPEIGRQELDTVGSGNGYFVTNGKAIKIRWKKEKQESKTIYTDENGKEIQLSDGQTWIQITPIHSQVKIEE